MYAYLARTATRRRTLKTPTPNPSSVQVELKFGQGPKTTVVELIKANDWMLPQLLAVYNLLEKYGLVDSAAQGSVAARSNHAVVQRFREGQAHEYPEHGIRDLHLSSPHLLHAGLEALMADAGASGQGWPGPLRTTICATLKDTSGRPVRHSHVTPTPTPLPAGTTPAQLLYEFAMLLGCYVRTQMVKPRPSTPSHMSNHSTMCAPSVRSLASPRLAITIMASLSSRVRT